MTLTRALGTIAASAVVCTAVGVVSGAALGHFCPDYYRAVLPPRPGVPPDPVQIGVGFGLNAGVFTGVLVGVIVVVVVAHVELRVRLARLGRGRRTLEPPHPAPWRTDGTHRSRGRAPAKSLSRRNTVAPRAGVG